MVRLDVMREWELEEREFDDGLGRGRNSRGNGMGEEGGVAKAMSSMDGLLASRRAGYISTVSREPTGQRGRKNKRTEADGSAFPFVYPWDPTRRVSHQRMMGRRWINL